MFAPPTSLMVVIGVLSSYLWTHHLMFQLAPYGLAIVPLFLLSPAIVEALLCLPLLFPSPYCFLLSIVPRLARGCASSCI
jgi:hypothetical protein